MQERDDAAQRLEQVLQRVGDKWTKRTIESLGTGPKRFGELRRELSGISTKVLAQLLRSLTLDGFLDRQVLTNRPLQVEYRLTHEGALLVAMMDEMRRWVGSNMIAGSASRKACKDGVTASPAIATADGAASPQPAEPPDVELESSKQS